MEQVFTWLSYGFMRHALLAVLLIAPLFALLSTLVISNRMVFFTDVLGHCALTGIAIGVLLGFREPTAAMMILAVILAAAVTTIKRFTKSSMDMALGVIFAFVVALGIVILSRQGGFVKYTRYLIGDILAVSPQDLILLGVMLVATIIYWLTAVNSLILVSVNESLARSRRIPSFLLELTFSILLALVVMAAIRLVGVLIVNSLLILPAVASRNIARNIRAYTFWAIVISAFSSIAGLIASYYWGSASGATIVLFAVGCYGVSLLVGKRFQ